MDKSERIKRSYKYVRLYHRIYSLLDVPILKDGADCGAICGRACCRPDEDMGLYLMPHEINMETIHDANFRWHRDRRRYFIQCDGTCDRRFRPLQCRIYPLMPVLYQGHVVIAKNNEYGCPIKAEDINKRFIKNLFKALHILRDRNKRIYGHRR